MAVISLLAAVDEASGLGVNNKLLCHLPADLQHFKTITMGKPIIMGRKTFESIGRVLPGRTNIVLSHNPLTIVDAVTVNSLDKAIASYSMLSEIIIIGGAQLFAQSMGLAHRLYITRIHHRFEADVFFPEIDEQQWRCASKEFRAADDKNNYDMTFYQYEKI